MTETEWAVAISKRFPKPEITLDGMSDFIKRLSNGIAKSKKYVDAAVNLSYDTQCSECVMIKSLWTRAFFRVHPNCNV